MADFDTGKTKVSAHELADLKSEDRQLIVDRRRLPIQIQSILAESVYVAGQIWAKADRRIRVQPHFFECCSSTYVKTFGNFSEDVHHHRRFYAK
jgi:hypothetical protein